MQSKTGIYDNFTILCNASPKELSILLAKDLGNPTHERQYGSLDMFYSFPGLGKNTRASASQGGYENSLINVEYYHGKEISDSLRGKYSTTLMFNVDTLKQTEEGFYDLPVEEKLAGMKENSREMAKMISATSRTLTSEEIEFCMPCAKPEIVFYEVEKQDQFTEEEAL